MKKTASKIILLIVIFSLMASFGVTVYAHSGRTDANGGHYNRATGEYHYHNGGSSGGSSGSNSGVTIYSNSSSGSSSNRTAAYSSPSSYTYTAKDKDYTGAVIERRYENKNCSIRIVNEYEKDCLVSVDDAYYEGILKFYVQSNDECTVEAPSGTLKFTFYFGDKWENEVDLFGSKTEAINLSDEVSLPWGGSIGLLIDENCDFYILED